MLIAVALDASALSSVTIAIDGAPHNLLRPPRAQIISSFRGLALNPFLFAAAGRLVQVIVTQETILRGLDTAVNLLSNKQLQVRVRYLLYFYG